MLTVDYEFIRLCNKIDEWKMEAEYWESKYTEFKKKYDELLNSTIKHNQDMCGNQLKLCMAISEDELKQAFKE